MMNAREFLRSLNVFQGDDWQLDEDDLARDEKAIEERDRQQFEAGQGKAIRAICPACAAGEIPMLLSTLGGWFHIGPEGEHKQRHGCSAAAIWDLFQIAAQPASEPAEKPKL